MKQAPHASRAFVLLTQGAQVIKIMTPNFDKTVDVDTDAG
jgi:hypothetical protein